MTEIMSRNGPLYSLGIFFTAAAVYSGLDVLYSVHLQHFFNTWLQCALQQSDIQNYSVHFQQSDIQNYSVHIQQLYWHNRANQLFVILFYVPERDIMHFTDSPWLLIRFALQSRKSANFTVHVHNIS